MKHYFYNGVELPGLPDPFRGASPMTDELFERMGGVITEDGQPTPEERVFAELNNAIKELSEQVPGVTIAEFKQAASTLYSGGLIAWAKSRSVPDSVIDTARARIVEIMADALRIGMTWDDMIAGIKA